MMCMRATYYLKSQLSAFHTKSQIMKWSKRCHFNGLNDGLGNLQKRAARFVTRNYSYETDTVDRTNAVAYMAHVAIHHLKSLSCHCSDELGYYFSEILSRCSQNIKNFMLKIPYNHQQQII